MKNRQNIKLSILLLILLVVGLQVAPDDTELFMVGTASTATVKSNVVILMDSSGSMNTIVFYPKKGLDGIAGNGDDGYDPYHTYTGTFAVPPTSLAATQWVGRWVDNNHNAYITSSNGDDWNRWTGCYSADGTKGYQVGSNSQYFSVGDNVLLISRNNGSNCASATIKSIYFKTDTPYFELQDVVGGPIEPNSDNLKVRFTKSINANYTMRLIKLYGTKETDSGGQTENVRYPQNYLTWIFSYATDTQRAQVTHFCTYGTFNTAETPNMATASSCDQGNGNRIKALWTRIQTAREVLCTVARTSNKIVDLGLFRFDKPTNTNGYDPEGAYMMDGLKDMSDLTSLQSYRTNVWSTCAVSWTPLAEALADCWVYFKPEPSGGKTYWPMSSYNNPTNSPIKYWCQNNYVVIMTDGESTKDTFAGAKYSTSIFKAAGYPVRRAFNWNTWTDGWGDTDINDPLPADTSSTASYCPNQSCWLINDNGTDYLDDVAYFIRNQDLFPDDYFGIDPETGWPGRQNIFTYVIAFNADNNLLQETASNGDGGYYTASNYADLVTAFQNVISSINLRNYAFSSITAPKKSTTAAGEDLNLSYVGYFMPSQSISPWEGHLVCYQVEDGWGFDTNNDGAIDQFERSAYPTELACLNASDGKTCERYVGIDTNSQEWDAADRIPETRNLYTHNYSSTEPTTDITLTIGNINTLLPLFVLPSTDDEATKTLKATQIINKINLPWLGDVFHSDVSYVGPPPAGKKYLTNIDPTGSTDEKYVDFYNDHVDRTKVLYVGTNDGIMHMLHADGPNAGTEIWGFIPDDVLPTLQKVFVDTPVAGQHVYTVDGRLTANDIYFKRSESDPNTWATILTFGLRQGGNSYYALDITDVPDSGAQPTLLWKFKDSTHSGQSWGSPGIGKIKLQDLVDSAIITDTWVEFLPGGFEFNNENPTNKKGKAVFVVDASNGQLLWMIGYDSVNGAAPVVSADHPEIETSADSSHKKYLTKDDMFNFSIPSALTAVDTDGNGYVDTVYFGNRGGHLFKLNISNPDRSQWKTYPIYKTDITTTASSTISSISGSQITVATKVFSEGQSIMGLTSYATGYITKIDNRVLTVTTTSGTFQNDETVWSRSYDPIYLAPAIFYDKCGMRWISFGTGDRDRPRTNPGNGRLFCIEDNKTYGNNIATANSPDTTLQQLVMTATDPRTMSKTDLDLETYNGWYMNFPTSGEKIFDPDPIVIPDKDFNPHIYLNTYQPPSTTVTPKGIPCEAPQEGMMTLYDITHVCGVNASIKGEGGKGRIAGGGIYGGGEYILFEGTNGQVASAPGGEDSEGDTFNTAVKTLPYPGGLVFWKEVKR